MVETQRSGIETTEEKGDIREHCKRYTDFYFALVSRLLDIPLDVPTVHFSEEALTKENQKILDQINQLNVAVLEIRELQAAFQVAPRRKVNGPKGVHNQLGITRQATYQRIDRLGLAPNDARDPNLSLDDVVKRSPKLTKLIQNIERIIAEMTLPT